MVCRCSASVVIASPLPAACPRHPRRRVVVGHEAPYVGDEGIVCSMGLLVPLVQRGQVLLGQFACQNEKSRTATPSDVIAAVPPHDSQVAFLP